MHAPGMEKKLNEKVENCLELVREIEKGNDSYDESVDPDWCPYCDMSYHDETDCPACAPWEGY